jgi:hypothetical protein
VDDLINAAFDASVIPLQAPLPRPVYVLGLDLGQTHDYSALALDGVHERGSKASWHLIRELKRWPLRTPYPQIVEDVGELVRRPPIATTDFLVIDQTGVGRPVVDMFRAAQLPIRLVAITITGGNQVIQDEDHRDEWHVPKRDLVSTVTVLLQAGRLKIAAGLAEAATLTHELGIFQTKITLAANDVYGAWREGQNDDTVLAMALACWYGERCPPPPASATAEPAPGTYTVDRRAFLNGYGQRRRSVI